MRRACRRLRATDDAEDRRGGRGACGGCALPGRAAVRPQVAEPSAAPRWRRDRPVGALGPGFGIGDSGLATQKPALAASTNHESLIPNPGPNKKTDDRTRRKRGGGGIAVPGGRRSRGNRGVWTRNPGSNRNEGDLVLLSNPESRLHQLRATPSRTGSRPGQPPAIALYSEIAPVTLRVRPSAKASCACSCVRSASSTSNRSAAPAS